MFYLINNEKKNIEVNEFRRMSGSKTEGFPLSTGTYVKGAGTTYKLRFKLDVIPLYCFNHFYSVPSNINVFIIMIIIFVTVVLDGVYVVHYKVLVIKIINNIYIYNFS